MPVYFIGQVEGGVCAIKIGVAKDIRRRLADLQTGNPSQLEVMGWVRSENDFRVERSLHTHFANQRGRGEWFFLEPADILPILEQAGRDGFVARNADAFEIIGRDKDAVAEYVGVWKWGDLELQECCPFCGCFCGMHFQDASWMYHCTNCDTLTDFSGPDEESSFIP